jgi:hypothetical protein
MGGFFVWRGANLPGKDRFSLRPAPGSDPPRQPLRAEEIRTGAMIAAQKGIIVVDSMALGRTENFFELCKEGHRGGGACEFSLLPWNEEPTYAEDDGDPMPPSSKLNQAQQFDAA